MTVSNVKHALINDVDGDDIFCDRITVGHSTDLFRAGSEGLVQPRGVRSSDHGRTTPTEGGGTTTRLRWQMSRRAIHHQSKTFVLSVSQNFQRITSTRRVHSLDNFSMHAN